MRHVKDRLHRLAVAVGGHGIEHQRQENWQGIGEDQRAQRDAQRVRDVLEAGWQAQKVAKVLEADVDAGLHALPWVVVHEGDLQAVHGAVAEDDVVDHQRDREQVQIPVSDQVFFEVAQSPHPNHSLDVIPIITYLLVSDYGFSRQMLWKIHSFFMRILTFPGFSL